MPPRGPSGCEFSGIRDKPKDLYKTFLPGPGPWQMWVAVHCSGLCGDLSLNITVPGVNSLRSLLSPAPTRFSSELLELIFNSHPGLYSISLLLRLPCLVIVFGSRSHESRGGDYLTWPYRMCRVFQAQCQFTSVILV